MVDRNENVENELKFNLLMTIMTSLAYLFWSEPYFDGLLLFPPIGLHDPVLNLVHPNVDKLKKVFSLNRYFYKSCSLQTNELQIIIIDKKVIIHKHPFLI